MKHVRSLLPLSSTHTSVEYSMVIYFYNFVLEKHTFCQKNTILSQISVCFTLSLTIFELAYSANVGSAKMFTIRSLVCHFCNGDAYYGGYLKILW